MGRTAAFPPGPEARKVLKWSSPFMAARDDSTLSVNPANYLEKQPARRDRHGRKAPGGRVVGPIGIGP